MKTLCTLLALLAPLSSWAAPTPQGSPSPAATLENQCEKRAYDLALAKLQIADQGTFIVEFSIDADYVSLCLQNPHLANGEINALVGIEGWNNGDCTLTGSFSTSVPGN